MTSTTSGLKTQLLERARELGFDACAIAPAVPAPHAEEFRRWLDDGHAASMAWMERSREKRMDPERVLPGVRSVIMLAINYWQGEAEPAPASGKVARYAWGDDYHDSVEPRLRELDGWLAARGGSQRYYVDTGPVLERDYAALAGLGWHGKSTMLISRELGTWFFLAEVLTTLPLPADEPARDRCGSCTRCITACPTGAIDAPHHLDARRCISYLTIENKGAIPVEFRKAIGDRIYGCDDCLEACPWNRFARESREAAFAARPVTRLPLRDLLGLSQEDFSRLFRGSPIKRIKRRGLLRNVCVALGNAGTAGDIPALERAARDEDAMVREHAEWAIRQIRPGKVWSQMGLLEKERETN